MIVIHPRQNDYRSGVNDHFLGQKRTADEGLNPANDVKAFPLEQKFIIAIQGKFSSFPARGKCYLLDFLGFLFRRYLGMLRTT